MNNIKDKETRIEAAFLHGDGETRAAINCLISRINETNGYCDPRIWLMLLDIYQLQGQQEAYEKLAGFFSNRFDLSPPAWENKKSSNSNNSWRNVLIIEDSPLLINDEKIKDFLRASKEFGNNRLDLSRIVISDSDIEAKKELKVILDIIKRLKKTKSKTLLMGDNEIISFLKKRIESNTSLDDNMFNKKDIEQEGIYWFLLFEFLQIKGEQENFEDLAIKFSEIFDYCPVGYEASLAIAVTPTEGKGLLKENKSFKLNSVVNKSEEITEFLQESWQNNNLVEISLENVNKITTETAREIVSFFEQLGDGNKVIFNQANEIVGNLLEACGVDLYSEISYKNQKLRDLIGNNVKTEKI